MSPARVEALRIPGAAFATILDAAAGAWPLECCGVLVGRRDGNCALVTRAVSTRNVAEDRGREFEVEPRALLAAHRKARESGEEILGPFHSHPNGRTSPSATDTARANEPGECWLIVAVQETGKAGDARAFAFDGAAFSEIALTIE